MTIPLPGCSSIVPLALGPGEQCSSLQDLGNPVSDVVDRRREQVAADVLGAALRFREHAQLCARAVHSCAHCALRLLNRHLPVVLHRDNQQRA